MSAVRVDEVTVEEAIQQMLRENFTHSEQAIIATLRNIDRANGFADGIEYERSKGTHS